MTRLNQKSIVALIALGLLFSTALVDRSHAQTGTRVSYATSNLINFQYRFWAPTGPWITGYAFPGPYGVVNNLDDKGWLWTPVRNGNGLPGSLTVDFGAPQAITSFRMYSVYNGGARGADLLVEHSDDGFSYSSADGGIVDFTTSAGGGVDNAGIPLVGFGGWYEMHTNPGRNPHQYWRISHSGLNTTDHMPRVGEVEFYLVADNVSLPTAVAGPYYYDGFYPSSGFGYYGSTSVGYVNQSYCGNDDPINGNPAPGVAVPHYQAGVPGGDLRPGTVLPDGSTVVSVEPIGQAMER